MRQLVPGAAIERATALLGCAPTPLFEEKGGALGQAAIAHVTYPVGIERTVAGPRLTPDDDPIDFPKAEIRERAKQRFDRQEAHLSRDFLELFDPPYEPGRLHRGAEPDVGQWLWCQPTHDAGHPTWALGEYLEDVLRSGGHHFEGFSDELVGHAFVEEVRHRVHEDSAGPSPSEGLP